MGVFLVLAACTSAPKTPTSVDATEASLPRSYGPVAPATIYGPLPEDSESSSAARNEIQNPDRIVLVFGAGLTHGYAYVGVLRALTELKIPVQAVYATEMGALAAALYYTQPNPNRVDWALLRFTEKNLRKPVGTFAFALLNSPENELSEKLRDVFGEKKIEPIADKLHVSVQDARSNENFDVRSGELWRIIRGALAGRNGFNPTRIAGKTVKASSRNLFDEYRIARQNEKYPIVVVSVGPPNNQYQRAVEEDHGIWISIPLTGIDDLDLKKKNQAIFSGKNAVHESANLLLGLVGRKPE